MEKKNVTEVVIDGVIYRLGGYESSEYLQQVAGYLTLTVSYTDWADMRAASTCSRSPGI